MIEVRGLTLDVRTERGVAHVLRGVDLDVGRGRILGIVGESGSGKSTLANLLLRLVPGNALRVGGGIRFRGQDLLALDEAAMDAVRGRGIALVPQDPMAALNPLFTVGTQLADALRRGWPGLGRRAALARAGAMLGRVGIADPVRRLRAYPHELSGGMRQRVMIAMALLMEPDVLVADEPTTALDATVEAEIVALFDGLRRDFTGGGGAGDGGRAVVFISHHLGLVAELCDDLCVMYGGLVVESGPVAAVLARPRHPYTAALLACEIGDGPPGRLVTIPGEVPAPTVELTQCIFLERCGFAAPVCAAGQPVLDGAGEGRRAACVRWREVEGALG